MKAPRTRRAAALTTAALALAVAGVVAGAQPASAATTSIFSRFVGDTVSGAATMTMSSDGTWRFSGSGRADPATRVTVTCKYFLHTGQFLTISGVGTTSRTGTSFGWNKSGTSSVVQTFFGDLTGTGSCSAVTEPSGV